jgi:hypothetical protein
MKISTATIGNRSRDLPVCSAVTQLTAPPHEWPVCNVIFGKCKVGFMARVRSWVIAIYSKVLKHYEWCEICGLARVGL